MKPRSARRSFKRLRDKSNTVDKDLEKSICMQDRSDSTLLLPTPTLHGKRLKTFASNIVSKASLCTPPEQPSATRTQKTIKNKKPKSAGLQKHMDLQLNWPEVECVHP